MVIDLDEAKGISALSTDVDLLEVQLPQVSRLTKVTMVIEDKNGNPIQVAVKLDDRRKTGSGNPYLTYAMLEYMFSKRTSDVWSYDYHGLTIDMSKWDFEQDVFEYPEKATSIVAMADEIKNILFPPANEVKPGQRSSSKEFSIYDQIRKLHDVANQRFHINLSIVSLICYAMARSTIPEEMGMARNIKGLPRPSSKDEVHMDRSVSSLFAHQGGIVSFTDPKFYYADGRPDYVLDALFLPQEVLKSRQRRGLGKAKPFKRL